MTRFAIKACLQFALFCLLGACSQAIAAPFTGGNILVSTAGRLLEYTRGGILVQEILVPYPETSYLGTRTVAGVVVDNEGKAHVGNYLRGGNSYLSTYDPTTASWEHLPDPSPYLSSDIDGHLAQFEDYVFANGYKYDVGQGAVLGPVPVSSYALPGPYFTLGVGLDSNLYSAGYDTVKVTNPSDFSFVREVNLDQSYQLISGVDAAADGTVFVVDYLSGRIQKYSSAGIFLGQLLIGTNAISLEIDDQGTILIGLTDGRVGITDTSLGSWSTISTSAPYASDTFPAFIVPEPSGHELAGIAIAAIFFFGVCRKQVGSNMPDR